MPTRWLRSSTTSRTWVTGWPSSGGLSFNLDAVIIPEEKEKLVQEGYERSDAIMEDYNMGLITNNERYNQIIDIWTNINTKLTKT